MSRWKASAFGLVLVCAVSLTGCDQDERPLDPIPTNGTLWHFRGNHSQRGSYSGYLDLRPKGDNTFLVTRVVDYDRLTFEGLQVQTVWTGTANEIPETSEYFDSKAPNALLIQYSLKRSDYIYKLNGVARTEQDRIPLTIEVRAKNTHVDFSDPTLGTFSEDVTSQEDVTGTPPYQEDVEWIASHREPGPFSKVLLNAIFARFQNYEPVARYKDRPEFKKGVHYFLLDRTDYDFYQKNPGKLRVANKVVDEISMTESIARRNAYSPSLEAKADYFQANMERHLSEPGMVAHALVTDNGDFVKFQEDGDSALWTGVYAMSQGMRYQLTGDPDALFQMKRAVRGLMTLMDITGDPKEFARTLEKYNPNVPLGGGWHRGAGPYADWNWLQGGNNDMYKGLVSGFLAAWLFLPGSEADFRAEVGERAIRLKDLSVPNKKSWNLHAALGLAALYSGKAEDLEAYNESYQGLIPWFSSHFDFTFNIVGLLDWSGLHLSAVSALSDILIAEKLGRTDIAEDLGRNFGKAWRKTKDTQRHFLTIMAKGLSYDRGLIEEGYKGDFETSMNRAIWGLREIPAPRPRYSVEIDHSQKANWCVSPYPTMPWKMWSSNPPPLDWHMQAIYQPPLFEFWPWGEKYVWKGGAFDFKLQGHRNSEDSGVDYLFAYWMSRYFGLF